MRRTHYRPVSCLARSAATSADLELDALSLLREAIVVRDKNKMRRSLSAEPPDPCVGLCN